MCVSLTAVTVVKRKLIWRHDGELRVTYTIYLGTLPLLCLLITTSLNPRVYRTTYISWILPHNQIEFHHRVCATIATLINLPFTLTHVAQYTIYIHMYVYVPIRFYQLLSIILTVLILWRPIPFPSSPQLSRLVFASFVTLLDVFLYTFWFLVKYVEV